LSLVELARYSDAALAHIIQGRLEAAGIPAFCFDTGMNVVESIPMLFQVRVMVLDEDLGTARQLIAQDPASEEPGAALAPRASEGYTTGRRQRRRTFYLVGFLVLPAMLFELARCATG